MLEKKTYSEEFKREALRLLESSGKTVAALERELGLSHGLLRGWREVNATHQRTHADFANCMKELVDIHFPEAQVIGIVLDNLNTQYPGCRA